MTLIIPESAIFRSTRLTVRCIIFQKISVQNGWMPLVARIGSGHTSKSLLITTLRALIALQRIHAIQCYRCGKSCYNLRILNTYFSFLAILTGFNSSLLVKDLLSIPRLQTILNKAQAIVKAFRKAPLQSGLEIGQIGVGNDPDPDPNRRVVGKGRSEQGPRSVNAMPWYRTGTDLSGLIPNRSVGRDR